MGTAAILVCLVIGIADGDSLRARCDTKQGPKNISVRLAEIDAPERTQPFGTRSRQHLAALCHRKQAEVAAQDVDRYGRTAARVTCAGRDANLEQVAAGLAWAYPKYVADLGSMAAEQ